MTFSVKDILELEVAPALGCTEPVAIALGAASAAELLRKTGVEPETIAIRVDPNIYKNGMAVSIPGADGDCGLGLASALGAVGGDAGRILEVLDPVEPHHVKRARALVREQKVSVELISDHRGLRIETRVSGGGHVAESVIEGLHDHLVSLTLNGDPVDSPLLKGVGCDGGSGKGLAELEAWLKTLRLPDLLALVDDLDEADRAFIQEGIDTNLRLADHGLKHGSGLGVGKTLDRLVRQKLTSRDMITDARILASSASDARMAGAKLPAMSSAGSGNHGLTAILPIVAVARHADVTEREVVEAVAFSHLVTAYVKAYTGRLSAICGCSVAAGAGATAGITLLLGGGMTHVAGAIQNLIEDLAGVICDGAKAGCAFKLATAAGTSVQAALFSLQGVRVMGTDGIISDSAEDTMRNVGTLTNEGMIETDRTILQIMLEKRFSDVK